MESEKLMPIEFTDEHEALKDDDVAKGNVTGYSQHLIDIIEDIRELVKLLVEKP